MVSVMIYPCMFCVGLSMDLFVLGVACLTGFVNCLGMVVILLFSVVGGALLDICIDILYGLPNSACVVLVVPVCI